MIEKADLPSSLLGRLLQTLMFVNLPHPIHTGESITCFICQHHISSDEAHLILAPHLVFMCMIQCVMDWFVAIVGRESVGRNFLLAPSVLNLSTMCFNSSVVVFRGGVGTACHCVGRRKNVFCVAWDQVDCRG